MGGSWHRGVDSPVEPGNAFDRSAVWAARMGRSPRCTDSTYPKDKDHPMRAVAIAASHVVSVEESARRIMILASLAFLALC